MTHIESLHQTLEHIRRVQELLNEVATRLVERARVHDLTKLCEPEASAFAECTERLRGMTYGSEEYKQCLADMKPALDHHYAHNTHHPEHHADGIPGMSLLDLIEMFCDWQAATERHADGDLRRSIEINQKRFGYGDELASIFRVTEIELLAIRQRWHCLGCGASDEWGNFCGRCGAGKDDYRSAPCE